jgi:hypothetical protein
MQIEGTHAYHMKRSIHTDTHRYTQHAHMLILAKPKYHIDEDIPHTHTSVHTCKLNMHTNIQAYHMERNPFIQIHIDTQHAHMLILAKPTDIYNSTHTYISTYRQIEHAYKHACIQHEEIHSYRYT